MPGATVTLLHHHVLDGTFEVQVGNRVVTLASQGLTGLLAEAVPPPSDPERPRRMAQVVNKQSVTS
jgi:hypothetical protein